MAVRFFPGANNRIVDYLLSSVRQSFTARETYSCKLALSSAGMAIKGNALLTNTTSQRLNKTVLASEQEPEDA